MDSRRSGRSHRALTSRPETRYAGALEMESALRDGLRGVAPAGGGSGWDAGEDATHAITPTAATSALPRTSAASARRQLQPIDEPPRRAQPARRAAAAPPERRRRGGGARWLVLLIVLALLAGGAYLVYDSATQTQRVQLREDVRGAFDEAIEELRGLINDNTR